MLKAHNTFCVRFVLPFVLIALVGTYSVAMTPSVVILVFPSICSDEEGTVPMSSADGLFIRPAQKSEIPSLINSLDDSDGLTRCQAARRLSAAGPVAAASLPKLLELAKASDAELRVVVASALASIAPQDGRIVAVLIDLLGDEDDRVKVAAVDALSRIGRAGKPAVPILVDMIASNYESVDKCGTAASCAIRALGNIGGEEEYAIRALCRVLADQNRTWSARCDSADSLGQLGPAAVDAVPVLIDALLATHDKVIDAPFGIPIVLNGRTVGDSTVDIRFSAARALGRIGPAARKAVPALSKALSDHASIPIAATLTMDDSVRITTARWTVCGAAAKSLGQIGRGAQPALPALEELFSKDATRERSEMSLELLSLAGAVTILDGSSNETRQVIAMAH